MTKITYASSDPWEHYLPTLRRLIADYGCKRICEIGGGAFPSMPLAEIQTQQLAYTVFDISPVELARTPAGYQKLQADICDPQLREIERFDLVCSKMLAEHVADAELFHRNVFNLLRPGGIAFHFFPTLYALPFLANKLMPEWLAGILFKVFARQDPVEHKKFHAVYHWCRGPTPLQLRRLARLQYEVLEYTGFFGHRYYDRVPGMRSLARIAVGIVSRFPNPHLTSFAFCILRRPD